MSIYSLLYFIVSPYLLFYQSSTFVLGIDIGTTSVKVCLLNTLSREVIVKLIKVYKSKCKARETSTDYFVSPSVIGLSVYL